MEKFNSLPLPVAGKKINFYYYNNIINLLCNDIEEFLDSSKFINNSKFTKSVLFPYEIKFNNSVEGYYDDIESIMKIINNPNDESVNEKNGYQSIINLIKGYNYILKHPSINEDNLKKLYNMLSERLLEPREILSKDQYYRKNDVYIFFSKRLDIEPDMGVRADFLPESMKRLFDYIDNEKGLDSISLKYVKSQIIHFYFVYLHPYYDVNGRTSRTLAIWYLYNNNVNAFTLFNRGIPYSRNRYYELIRYTKRTINLTTFLIFMLNNVKKELQKEHIINNVEDSINAKLSFVERQTLNYILENKVNTFMDFVTFYHRFNNPKCFQEVYEQMFFPLLEKQIVVPTRETKKHLKNGKNNFCYEINQEIVDTSILKK
ncbi:MAG: Fic family protein [Bacilli bacterium]|nr:Fic family protein [Bacilli bacterium]MDD3304890.1 Fic family protein [Bacilli bacterium]MDD4053510.1 Fic family protein [Bacilli bacterium]MDD4411545.1 Fic family protein [Bacilli bacterium]